MSKQTSKSATKRATVTGGTFDATKAATHKCSGLCGQRLPIKKFPTTKQAGVRVAECRGCRDARYKAMAAVAAAKEASE